MGRTRRLGSISRDKDSLKSKVDDNFHVRVLQNSKNKNKNKKKKTFVRVNLTVFQTNSNLLLSKDEKRCRNIIKMENSSFTLMLS